MRLSPTTGTIVSGQGGGTLAIDGVTPASLSGASGGGWGWLDDTTVAGQADTGTGYKLYQLVLPNTLTVLDATSTGVTDAAQNFRAGASEWAAFMTGGVLKGVRSATVPFTGGTTVGTCTVLPLAGLGDIDDSGRVFTIGNYAGDQGVVAYAGAGTLLWSRSTGVLDGGNRLRAKNGTVAYQDTDSAWHLLNATTGAPSAFAPRTDEVIAQMVPVVISGAVWVVELSNTKLTIRPAISGSGYILATSANLFNPDALTLSPGVVRVGWSVTTGEAPTDLRLADLTVGTGGWSSGTTAGGSLVITPEGTPLVLSPLPVGPIEGGTGAVARLAGLYPEPIADAKNRNHVTVPWYQFFQSVSQQIAAPIPASRIVPPIPPAPAPSFGTIDVAGQSAVVATVDGDAVQFIEGTGVTITTDAAGQSVTFNSTGLGGDVVGPGSSTDNAIARFDGTTGKLIQNSGITISDVATGTLSGTNTGDQNLFQTIAVSGQSDVVADTTADTLTLVAGTNITITTDAATDSITFDATGGSGAGGWVEGVMRTLGDGSTTDFVLADVAESLLLVSIAGAVTDPLLYTLSADGGDIVFDTAPGAADVVTINYVTASV